MQTPRPKPISKEVQFGLSQKELNWCMRPIIVFNQIGKLSCKSLVRHTIFPFWLVGAREQALILAKDSTQNIFHHSKFKTFLIIKDIWNIFNTVGQKGSNFSLGAWGAPVSTLWCLNSHPHAFNKQETRLLKLWRKINKIII